METTSGLSILLHAAFHQGLHCLLRQKLSSEKEKLKQFCLEIITFVSLIYIMDYPEFMLSTQKEEFNSAERGLIFFIIFYFQKSNPSFSYEIIIVDDGSKDKTSEVCITIGLDKQLF